MHILNALNQMANIVLIFLAFHYIQRNYFIFLTFSFGISLICFSESILLRNRPCDITPINSLKCTSKGLVFNDHERIIHFTSCWLCELSFFLLIYTISMFMTCVFHYKQS